MTRAQGLVQEAKSTGICKHWGLPQLQPFRLSAGFPSHFIESECLVHGMSVITVFHELLYACKIFLLVFYEDGSECQGFHSLLFCCTCAGRWQTYRPSTKLSNWKGTEYANCWHMRRPGAVIWKKVWTKHRNMPGSSTVASKTRYPFVPF